MTNITYRHMVPQWGLGCLPIRQPFLRQIRDGRLNTPFQPFIWSLPTLHMVAFDNIFMIWTRSVQDLNTFTSFLNNIHPTIKFTCDHSFTSIPFLDVNVSLHNGKIVADLYTKPTDKNRYLPLLSCHPAYIPNVLFLSV